MNKDEMTRLGLTPIEDLITEDFGAVGTPERITFDASCDSFIIGEKIREMRNQAGLTQEQLAEKIGISVKYISRIETGKSGIKTQTLIKYINLLGITPNVFYKSFVDNSEIMSNIRLSEKIETLSEDKKEFISNIIDELKHIK